MYLRKLLLSLFLGGLFLLMLISVVAFRKPTSSSPTDLTLPSEMKELTEILTTVANEERPQNEETTPTEHSNSRRSRTMTIAQVLPLLISSVPVHTGITIHPIETPVVRRHSLSLRPRLGTICTEPPAMNTIARKNFKRTRANTIAGPPPLTRILDRSMEQIRPPLHPLSLAPIASADEYSDEDEKASSSLLSSPSLTLSPLPNEQIDATEQSSTEKHWLLNGRFLLFCLSNFTLCLVMGVPYVIIPTYISETFRDQRYLASWTLSNVGIASALGQILLGYLHDRKVCSAWFMYTLAVIISGTSLVILALFRYKFIVLICAFLYGLAISANYALQVLIVIDALSIENMANAFGILQFCQGVSTLIGIPLQGIVLN